jgi:hypothetical protein
MALAPVVSGDLIQAGTINNIVSGAIWYSSDSGTANSYKVTFDGTTTNKNKITGPLTAGLLISFTASATNTGASTLAVVGPSGVVVATPPICKANGAALSPGDIVANQMVTVIYNAAQARFEQISSAPSSVSNPVARGVELLTSNPYVLPNLTSVSNPVWTANVWQSDPGYWTPGSNVITIPAGLGGKYFVKAVIQFPVMPNTCVVVLGLNNGSPPVAYTQYYIPPSAGAHTVVDISAVLTLGAGATISFFALQNTGAEVALVSSGSSIQAVLIGA